MSVYQGEPTKASEPLTPTAAAELAARVDDVVCAFRARVAAPVEASALDTLRADILAIARSHAARTVLDTITARESARATKRQRRCRHRRP